nr:immunoglobulin light chain junction region [Macaca mulatta]MOX72275.1 immunoglobulin light chain junction region [Macaca mulatta]
EYYCGSYRTGTTWVF